MLTAVAVRSPALRRLRRQLSPAPRPVSAVFGLDRGTPVDRFFIERFLDRNRRDIRGRVLEFEEALYAPRYGSNVEHVDVLHPTENGHATVVADLLQSETLPTGYDCVIATQVLQYVFDVRSAVAGLHTMLAPGGVALVTLPVVSRISPGDQAAYGEYWRFAPDGARRLFDERFSEVETEAHGNVATACAFLQGIAAEELGGELMSADDEAFPVLVTVRARK
jgi:SAM-dependent methyltransferase